MHWFNWTTISIVAVAVLGGLLIFNPSGSNWPVMAGLGLVLIWLAIDVAKARR